MEDHTFCSLVQCTAHEWVYICGLDLCKCKLADFVHQLIILEQLVAETCMLTSCSAVNNT